MSDTRREAYDALTARVTGLEEIVMHQDHTLQQLHEVLLEQDRRLTALETGMKRLATRLQTLSETPAEESRPDEKPPHY